MTERPSILAIDDEPNNFDVIQTLLGTEAYTFNYASSGQRALNRLDRFHPDLILLDVMMPDLDGIEVCRRIRALPKWRSIPIILVTALTDRAELARCMSTGADDFLIKPIDRLKLSARVSSILRLKLECDRLQLANQKLELAAKAQSDRLAIVSHKLGVRLEDSISTTQRLVATELTPEQSTYASTILVDSQILLAGINDLLPIDSLSETLRERVEPSDLETE
jgi:two-component system, sensor histidine kinase and response regulator